MRKQRYFWFSFLLLFLIVLASCESENDSSRITAQGNTLQKPLPIDLAVSSKFPSIVQATFSGAENGQFHLQGDGITSKLRHGHLEFTIFLSDGTRSFFIAFHGYTGPRAYTLLSIANGGDVHLALGRGQPTWDLSLHQTATCRLLVESELPTDDIEVHRMKGQFSCPALYSNDSGFTQKSVAISQGIFDVSIIVES